ncbi:nickel-responsive transcriptional regulator NikR [Ramlibacter sp.]|uniref:nickel-responsive transcriptional regulator NikR n=1 Tax=Ramlibacter sp. TaxID=1917967 RepID=UPI0018296FF5|nr:nickel-responsive transcriptional regulator NikR [Ramlibacter sp.]MBA2675736.1 nickel-responsive transcriptional regulator NikR [Ramlibacter sp.]
MQRFTISLDEDLAGEFDRLIAVRGYVNRSEAVRDLIRERLGSALLDARKAKWCAATVTFVYDRNEHPVTARVMDLQHQHHDLVVSSLQTRLDHDNCLETVVLRGPTVGVQDCASQLIALRGVRHGQIHVLALSEGQRHHHSHAPSKAHTHLKPMN